MVCAAGCSNVHMATALWHSFDCCACTKWWPDDHCISVAIVMHQHAMLRWLHHLDLQQFLHSNQKGENEINPHWMGGYALPSCAGVTFQGKGAALASLLAPERNLLICIYSACYKVGFRGHFLMLELNFWLQGTAGPHQYTHQVASLRSYLLIHQVAAPTLGSGGYFVYWNDS